MKPRVLLLTPPFTQLNTPYPATAYLTGFLKPRGYEVVQADLGLDTLLALFTSPIWERIFEQVAERPMSTNARTLYAMREEYLRTLEPVIRFLQHKNPTLAYGIAEGDFLPQAGRFQELADLEWAFGTLGVQDKARHLATLYLEDLGDFLTELVDPHFGFSRYAERLGRSATHFDALHEALQKPPSQVQEVMLKELEAHVSRVKPDLVCLSVPFPGNLFGALRIGQYIKRTYPDMRVAMGGGYPNTELRSLREPRVFESIDYITLDDGERPLLCLLEYLEGKRTEKQLKRTFVLNSGEVTWRDGALEGDFPFSQTGTPSYEGLRLHEYLSVIEVANPMHRLWSDGRWNKLTMAHGCYWKKCSFCDISLDYIRNYDPVNASLLCDRMEELMASTGETGFHFVDEAAPPALMKELALEILRRKLTVTWWTNIRFEQNFTADLCRLLRASGCIAVSGGLEVASDRLLALMEKGVTVEQVARVAAHFTDAGSMVHAYLMYGFPTQSAQETIDSLEVVRQLFEQGVMQSGFWHLFAMTSHSPVGLNPAKYGVVRTGPTPGPFADNDLSHDDPQGCDHEMFSDGLRKSLFNFMNGIGLDFPLSEWFDFKVPRTSLPPHLIYRALETDKAPVWKDTTRLVWLGKVLSQREISVNRKGKKEVKIEVLVLSRGTTHRLVVRKDQEPLLKQVLSLLGNSLKEKVTFGSLKQTLPLPEAQWMGQAWWGELRKFGLLGV
jgi:hypothetical protein